MILRIARSILFLSSVLLAQAPEVDEKDMPALVKFVAPAYPRAARDVRVQGKTLTMITIGRDGSVVAVDSVSAHAFFKSYVVEALKQWRFKPSDGEHTLKVTCLFELTGKCEGTPSHPVTAETSVSAELPAFVHITTDWVCWEPDR